jgi:hypothetical protein
VRVPHLWGQQLLWPVFLSGAMPGALRSRWLFRSYTIRFRCRELRQRWWNLAARPAVPRPGLLAGEHDLAEQLRSCCGLSLRRKSLFACMHLSGAHHSITMLLFLYASLFPPLSGCLLTLFPQRYPAVQPPAVPLLAE